MSNTTTEQINGNSVNLDLRSDEEVLALLLEGQAVAIASLRSAIPAISSAAALMTEAMRGDGRLIYAAAGASGLMALGDGAELHGTFGLDVSRIFVLMAGGLPTRAALPADAEDDVEAGEIATWTIRPGDVAITLSASGATPYTLAFAKAAKKRGAKVIGLANNQGAPLLEIADVPVLLPTPPEALAGSTRLGAGTAQKAALNMMSTLMGVRLGHVHDGLMVNVLADNAKLRQRAAGIVAEVAGVSPEVGAQCLARADGQVKLAILLASGAPDLTSAQSALDRSEGVLRRALAEI